MLHISVRGEGNTWEVTLTYTFLVWGHLLHKYLKMSTTIIQLSALSVLNYSCYQFIIGAELIRLLPMKEQCIKFTILTEQKYFPLYLQKLPSKATPVEIIHLDWFCRVAVMQCSWEVRSHKILANAWSAWDTPGTGSEGLVDRKKRTVVWPDPVEGVVSLSYMHAYTLYHK